MAELTPAEHHAKHCESRPAQPQASLEACPFRAWHDTQEPRP